MAAGVEFNPKGFIAIYNFLPVVQATGFEIITPRPAFIESVSVDARFARTVDVTVRYILRLNLRGTSITNDILSLLHILDLESNGTSYYPFFMTFQGLQFITDPSSYIIGFPSNVNYSFEQETKSWNIQCSPNCLRHEGGAPLQSLGVAISSVGDVIQGLFDSRITDSINNTLTSLDTNSVARDLASLTDDVPDLGIGG